MSTLIQLAGTGSNSTLQHNVKYGEAINKGQAVYVSSADGTNMIVSKADYSTEATSSKTMGLVMATGALNYQGVVITEGLLAGTGAAPLNTSTAAIGDPVWLGANGNLIFGLANKPYAPNHLVFIGIVTRVSATVGEIFVKVQNGFELDEIHNVDLHTIAPVDGDGLFYDGTTGLWKNKAPNSTPAAQTVLFADLATTEALKACTYSNGTLGVGATLTGNANGQLSTVSFTDKIDNVTTALGQVILVQSQTDKKQNGLYVVTQLGDASTPFILTRSTDADTQAELYPLQINVFSGATLANRAFLQKTVDPVVGTDNIVFTTSAIGLTNTPVRHVDTVTSSALPACTYTSGTNVSLPGHGAYLEANANGALGTINGIALVVGNRILVKDQANQAHNGDYVVSNAGSGSAKWKLVRVSAWGAEFVRLEREWKVNNPSSTKYGARYSTSLSSLANIAVGTTNIVFSEVANAGGRFGIADSNGAYSYYGTLQSAINAAVAGQTVEAFTDYVETGAVGVNLKNGVNINLNGHTYTLNNAGTNDAVTDNSVTLTCTIFNGTIERSGGTSSPVNTTALAVKGASKITLQGVTIKSTFGCAAYIVGEVVGGHYIGSAPGGLSLLVAGIIRNASFYSAVGTARIDNLAQDCTFRSDGSYGVIALTSTRLINCVGFSTSSYGIYNGGVLINSTGFSTASDGVYNVGQVRSSAGYSTASTGIFTGGTCENSSGISTVSYGILGSGDAKLYNCHSESSAQAALFTQGYVYGCTAVSSWNNANGHAIVGGTVAYKDIFNCVLEVTNASANCLYWGAPISCYYGGNTFKGATTPVNANVSQSQVNTQDSFGNMLIG